PPSGRGPERACVARSPFKGMPVVYHRRRGGAAASGKLQPRAVPYYIENGRSSMARKRDSEAPAKGGNKKKGNRRKSPSPKKQAARSAEPEESVEVKAELVGDDEIEDEESIDETEAQAYDDDIGEPE